MVWLIPHPRLRLIALLLSSTLLGCPQTRPKDVGQCNLAEVPYAIQKSTLKNMALVLQSTNGWRKSFVPPTIWSMSFGFSQMTLNVVWVATNCFFGLAYSINTWPVKISTNLMREEVLTLKDIGFQLQQREAFCPRHILSTIATLPIPWWYFCVPPNLDTLPTTRFSKTVHCNPATPMANHKTNGSALESWTIIMLMEWLPFHIQDLEW